MNLIKNVKLSYPIQYNSETSSTSIAVDMQGYEGVIFALQVGTSGSTAITMHIECGSSSGMSDMVDQTGTSIISTSTGRTMVASDFYKPIERYVRPVVIADTESVYSVLAMQYGARMLPVSQSSDVTADELNVSSSGTV
jgi:hypothetical protein